MIIRSVLSKSQAALWCYLIMTLNTPALAAENIQEIYSVRIKNHEFLPNELMVPAGQKIKITVENLDPTPEEFESYDLHREKVISGNSKVILFIGPLKPGAYKYFGEFHQETAQGTILVKEDKS